MKAYGSQVVTGSKSCMMMTGLADPTASIFLQKLSEKEEAEFYFSAYTNAFPDGHSKNISLNFRQLKYIETTA